MAVMCPGSFSAAAATWYLHFDSSTDWNTLTNWYSLPLAGGSHPGSISTADTFDLNGYSIITPIITIGTTIFGGKELVLHGGVGGFVSTKTTPPAGIVISNLCSYGGYIQNSAGSGTLSIQISNFQLLGTNANTTLSPCNSTRGLALTIDTLQGSGDLTALGVGGGAAGGAVMLNIGSATNFTGTLYIANGCQFTFNSAMTSGGALSVSGAGTQVCLSNTVTFKGMTLNGTNLAAGTYSSGSVGFIGPGTIVVQGAEASTNSVNMLFGVNLPGGSFSSGSYYPTDQSEWTYYQGKKLRLVRLAFLWQRVQPALNGPLDSSAISSIDTAVSLAASSGMKVLLDMHNYDRYPVSGSNYLVGSAQVPYSAYQQAWSALAAHYANLDGVFGYDIMNEPNGTGGTWPTAAQYGVNGVRAGDTAHYVIVEGDNYAGAQTWMSQNANLNVTDPANMLLYSAHTYWDANDSGVYSGTYDSNNVYPNVGIDRVAQFVYWLQLKGAVGFVGEFGVPNNVASPDSRWNEALANFLHYLNINGVSGTYWSGGECWPGSYALSCATGNPPVDAPAMSVLELFGGGTLFVSFPAVTLHMASGNQLQFNAPQGFVYQLQSSTNLGSSGNWTNCGSSFPGGGATNITLPDGNNAIGFYRVVVSYGQ
jgi:aryl-phospho-beta-D-glucosidase BglC (GH1 family)